MKIAKFLSAAAAFAVLSGCGPRWKLDENCQRFMTSEYGPGFYRNCWSPS